MIEITENIRYYTFNGEPYTQKSVRMGSMMVGICNPLFPDDMPRDGEGCVDRSDPSYETCNFENAETTTDFLPGIDIILESEYDALMTIKQANPHI